MTKDKRPLDRDLRAWDVQTRKWVSWIGALLSFIPIGFYLRYSDDLRRQSDYYKMMLPVMIFAAGLLISAIKALIAIPGQEREMVSTLLSDICEITNLHTGTKKVIGSDDVSDHLELVAKLERISTLVRIGHYSEYHFAIHAAHLQKLWKHSIQLLSKVEKTDKAFAKPNSTQTELLFKELERNYILKLPE
jgi:hypothetical protein